MNVFNHFGVCLLAVCIGATATSVVAEDLPPVPSTPAPILDVVSVRPFTLEGPATHGWRSERPTYTTGYLLVLRVEPSCVWPRQVAQPVLYVGNQTAERVNHGHESGLVVAIVPAVLDPKDPEHLDLSKAPLWFGTPELPERVDARTIERERRAAEAAGIRAIPADRLADARTQGGALLEAPDKAVLLKEVAGLVAKHSPQERELVERLTLE